MTQSFCRKLKASPFFKKTGIYQLLGYSVYNKDKVTFIPGGDSHLKGIGVPVVPFRVVESRLTC